MDLCAFQEAEDTIKFKAPWGSLSNRRLTVFENRQYVVVLLFSLSLCRLLCVSLVHLLSCNQVVLVLSVQNYCVISLCKYYLWLSRAQDLINNTKL
jgi:hypothetical protein